MTRARQLIAIAAGGALMVMMLLTFVDVVGRYGLNHSVFGSAEMVELLMAVLVFGGLALVTLADEHISVTMFDHLLPARAMPAMTWLRRLFTLGCYGALTVALAAVARDGMATHKTSVVLQLPQWWASGAGALLSAAGTVLYAAALAQRPAPPAASAASEAPR